MPKDYSIKFTPQRFNEIIEGIKSAKIAVVGDVMLDRYVWGVVERISPEAPVPIVSLTGESTNLGGAANVAANVSSLGAEVVLFGVVGDDDDGRKLIELALKNGFNEAGLAIDKNRPTTVKTRVISQSQHIVRIDKEVIHSISPDIEEHLINRFLAFNDGFDAIILEDYNKGVLTPKLIEFFIKWANEAKIPIGVDPKKENFWVYKHATLFKPNLRELENALGYSLRDEQVFIEGCKKARERLEVDYLLVTRGEQGMTLFSKDSIEVIPTRAHRVADVSGAGDTVIATLITALTGGATIREAASLANFAASVVIAELGAVPVDLMELQRTAVDFL